MRSRSSVSYTGPMKQWLAEWKYRGRERLEPLFGHMIDHAFHLLIRSIRDERAHDHSASRIRASALVDWITYVPVSAVRMAERGFNQAERLAASISSHTGIPVAPLLERSRHSAKQSSLNRSNRLAALDHTFVPTVPASLCERASMPQGRSLRIVVVDDVFTTGSTLERCAEAIRTVVPASVYGLTWAR